MLFRAEAFEPLTDEPWDERRVRDGIRTIVADVDAAFDPGRLWPAHEWDGWRTPLPLKTLYVGAAGVVHALDILRRRGDAETRIDLPAAALRTLELRREAPDQMAGPLPTRPTRPGLLSGETGILVVAWRLTKQTAIADDLHARVVENVDNEARELMWGSPGTMVAARAMLTWSGEERWAEAWRRSADALWLTRDDDGLWTKRLYGRPSRGLGPPHGVVGVVAALLGGGGLLEPARRAALEHDTAAALARAAVREDGLANWPSTVDSALVDEEDGEIRLQWCAGAPGIVATAAPYLDEELLLAGAETVWRAGPQSLEKGAGICHGSAAGGYAFLKAFERTGDERWLERARRFAVHALGQVDRLRADRGRGRYSLWTGDPGTALFASDCLGARTAYPVVDAWD